MIGSPGRTRTRLDLWGEKQGVRIRKASSTGQSVFRGVARVPGDVGCDMLRAMHAWGDACMGRLSCTGRGP